VTLCGQYEESRNNGAAWGFPSCPYADLEDDAYVRAGVLYDWSIETQSGGDYSVPANDYEFPCGCEIPGAARALRVARAFSCAAKPL
jgi:hypothetical protein